MNRYSLIFALLIATSFVVQSPQAGKSTAPPVEAKKSAPTSKASSGAKLMPFIGRFLYKAQLAPNQKPPLQILFATVPHPVETHLAAAFDHNVDALQNGLQESGYLFDSSWIPWSNHAPREQFDDDEKEKNAAALEDESPGILLFRSNDPNKNPYANGIIVFLITEKPTEGIALPQVKMAVRILRKSPIPFSGPIRILGPTYSGSFASLISIVQFLHRENPAAEVFIRSGGVTDGVQATGAISALAKSFPMIKIDFGSAHHDYADSVEIVVATLKRMGIERSQSAMLNEDESVYGELYRGERFVKSGLADRWSLVFPRDISSLRKNYEEQGIFDVYSPAQPWKRFLNLKSDQHNEGDSIRSFGGSATMAAKESILFGVSEFLNAHHIRAVIISATNEEDRYFLTQFLHVHNGNVRVVVIGSTRIFMRGSTAQFSGDMVVDEFPMLPLLYNLPSKRTAKKDSRSAKKDDYTAPIFADDVAQGIYFATIDLLTEPPNLVQKKWYPEYCAPHWKMNFTPVQRPPMYITALGSNSMWPVAESPGFPWHLEPSPLSRVEMPFVLFEQNASGHQEAPWTSQQIEVGTCWVVAFRVLVLLIASHSFCFFLTNPASWVTLASFTPSPEWRFWLLKVAIPAAVAGCAFRVLAWAVEMPFVTSSSAVWYWRSAEALTVLAPLLIAASALFNALVLDKLKWRYSMRISLLPAVLAVMGPDFARFFSGDPFDGRDVGSILNTYREMHWESGLSLVPTAMFLLLAFLGWASHAGDGAVLLGAAPKLPDIPWNFRISQAQAETIKSIALPIPDFGTAKTLWIMWGGLASGIVLIHFCPPWFKEITTLESLSTTRIVMGVTGTIAALILLDVLQLFRLWAELRGLLRMLDRETFKRSFVPIQDVKWRNLWSFARPSVHEFMVVLGLQCDCVLELWHKHKLAEFETLADYFERLRSSYNNPNHVKISSQQYRDLMKEVNDNLADAGTKAASLIEGQKYAAQEPTISSDTEALQRALACLSKGNGTRFSDEAEELARLPEWQRTAEKLLCLIYIGFIKTVVARLRTLFKSIASIYSLLALGMAFYPFVPFSPLLIAGIVLLLVISVAFFTVFSQVDTDPILSRIVNGDDRKLQGNFYVRFAEAIALPLLTLGSSLLPGGPGRLLGLLQTLFMSGQ